MISRYQVYNYYTFRERSDSEIRNKVNRYTLISVGEQPLSQAHRAVHLRLAVVHLQLYLQLFFAST